MMNVNEIPDLKDRYECMWGGHMYPHHIEDEYWPTRLEFELLRNITISSSNFEYLDSKIGEKNTLRVFIRWSGVNFYIWMNDNFLKYCKNYKKNITKDLFQKAYEDYIKEICIPWLDSEENKTLTDDELREKYSSSF